MEHFSKMNSSEFNDYLTAAAHYNAENTARLTVSVGNAAALAAQITAYNANWVLYINADTRTHTVIINVKAQRLALEALLSDIFNDIPKSVITSTDTSTLGIKAEHAAATPTPIMSQGPLMTRRVIGLGLSEIRFQDSSLPDSKALPPGQAFIFMKLYVGAPLAAGAAIPFSNYYHTIAHPLRAGCYFCPGGLAKLLNVAIQLHKQSRR